MPKYIVDSGDDFVVAYLDRDTGGRQKEVFKVRGADGKVELPANVVLGTSASADLETTQSALYGSRVQKLAVAINATDFDALGNTDTSEVLNLGSPLPANARIVGINIKLATAFTGGGNAAVAVKVGSSGDDDALVSTANLLAAAVDGVASAVTRGIAPDKHFATATQLTGTFTADVGLKELTAGAGTIEIYYVVLA